MSYTIPNKIFKSKIRKFELENLSFGESFSLPFIKSENGSMKPLFALEILMNIPKNYPEILKEYWGEVIYDMFEWAKKAEQTNCDILALKFNINNENEINKATQIFSEILKVVKKPLIVTGTNKKNFDVILLPQLAEIALKPCIFGVAEQDSYKDLAKVVKEKEHYIIARTPIDINLAKELNILLTDCGISKDKILIDTNMAALGYGLDYGYSIMEKVKLAGLDGDEMLDMPVLAFAGEEAWKVKEAKSGDFNKNYGDYKSRAIAWESATAAAVMLAGANILLLWHPETINGLKKFAEAE